MSGNGGELFYQRGNKIMTVEIQTSPSLSPGIPKTVFELPYQFLGYDVSPDGRFLMLKPNATQASPAHLNIVLNWLEHLKKQFPQP